MRRTDLTRSVRFIAVAAAASVVLAACGGGADDAAPSPSAAPDAPPVDVAKALTQQEVPAGLTVTIVPADTAFQNALSALGPIEAADITPAACKDKNVAVQQEVFQTIKYGVQESLSKDKTVVYGVTLLPNSARLSVFEAAGTGECGSIKFGGALEQTTTRKSLPADVDGATGFVLDIIRKANGQTVAASSAYFTKGGVLAMVNANPGTDGTVDQAQFDDLVKRVAAKL